MLYESKNDFKNNEKMFWISKLIYLLILVIEGMISSQQMMGSGNGMLGQQGSMTGPMGGPQTQMGPPQGQMGPQGPTIMQQMRPQMSYVDQNGRVIQSGQ